MSKVKSYDSDGRGREELAKFKKAYFAGFPATKEWKSIKKSIEFFRNWDVAGSGWYHTTYFLPCPFKIGNRLPDKSRIIDHWSNQLMLVLATDINPNGITGKDDIGRTYSIRLSGRATIIPYRCRYDHVMEWFKIYVYGRTIEETLKKFWESYDQKATRFPPALR